jgi:hypothetical protein
MLSNIFLFFKGKVSDIDVQMHVFELHDQHFRPFSLESQEKSFFPKMNKKMNF